MKQHRDDTLLKTLNTPQQLRSVNEAQLLALAQQIRQFLLTTLSKTGGHLASNLGTVELTLALHYVFNTPHDRLVWDVGHQAYTHKILTERREAMAHIRQQGGISGFPRRNESPYDAFGVGHSSTSISAALGMSLAHDFLKQTRKTVAIIGDGAMTAGMAFEALNHAGGVKANLLVVLNDNDMSISENVGALSNYLSSILSSHFYTSLRESSKKALKHMPTFRELAKRTEEHFKGMIAPGTLFEELGFNYIGPIDGHNLPLLIKTLTNMQGLTGPQFLHVVTQKGKGFLPAENNPLAYHGVSAFDCDTGQFSPKPKAALTYTQVFSQWLCDQAMLEPKLFAITPAMCEGSGLVEFAKRHPERYIDVGIAEQHSVTLAAGLACEGIKPVVAIYSTFLQRAYDQLIHDVALQQLPVLFAIDRAGIVGADGATHVGLFDLSYLRCIPNMVVMTPSDENECYRMLSTGLALNLPCAVRYPRAHGTGVDIDKTAPLLPLGKAQWVLQRDENLPCVAKISLLVFGTLLSEALQVGQRLNAHVIDMRFVKPLDIELLEQLQAHEEILVTVEENVLAGGAGSAVNEFLLTQQGRPKILNLALPDLFIEQGKREDLLKQHGLDAAGMLQNIQHFIDT
jgi:1-deoxy-D-xylulose-5-phosphate synthase